MKFYIYTKINPWTSFLWFVCCLKLSKIYLRPQKKKIRTWNNHKRGGLQINSLFLFLFFLQLLYQSKLFLQILYQPNQSQNQIKAKQRELSRTQQTKSFLQCLHTPGNHKNRRPELKETRIPEMWTYKPIFLQALNQTVSSRCIAIKNQISGLNLFATVDENKNSKNRKHIGLAKIITAFLGSLLQILHQ